MSSNPILPEECKLGAECPSATIIAKLQTQISELQEQVRTDHLTGLFNIRHLHFTLAQEMERTQRTQQPTTLIMVDVDHFKVVNDTHGHLIGDKVLVHLASIIKQTVRILDIPCRYGGEEFSVILPSTPLTIGVQVAERLRQKIESTPVLLETSSHSTSAGPELMITASLGLHTYQHFTNESMDEFIAHVDKQLYKAKENGRNQVCHASISSREKQQVSMEEKAALFDFEPNPYADQEPNTDD